ncbi:MAG: S8 family serine peptidase, partial [Flavobacteriaceae bacterium]
MKNHYFLRRALTLGMLLSITLGYSQTKQQRDRITQSYDLVKLNQLKEQFKSKEKIDQEKAFKAAKANGWPITKPSKNGAFDKLQRLRLDGTPVYYTIYNTAAARSTRANFLHNGGGLGLNVEGQSMTAHVWDGGPTRPTHEDLVGRLTINDGETTLNGNSFHAQHVTGTIAGTGLGNDAQGRNSKGMAPKANVLSHDWDNDLSEAAGEAINGMLLSNHSYGAGIENVPDWAFGAYTLQSQAWDELMYNAPYYLMVAAAGNDGNTNNENGAPLNFNSSYDKLSGNKTSKNNMVVANGQDANIAANGSLNSVSRNGGSSEGPTDDFRIKPDIMGNGTSLFSAYDTSNTAYNTISGTSMASPNVCGSMLLLQQHYNNTNGNFMRAATLKGLTLHTADDTETTGPDANTGWGLMNTKAAAETISGNGLSSWISEESLSQGETFTMTVQSDGSSPLLASISWTDPVTGGYVNTTGAINDGTATLVNDLDIRVSQASNTYYPWRLTGVNSNTNGNGTDNTVDPFERVDVNGASGTYTITVTHKGSLYSGKQNFSLIVTGLSSDIALINKSGNQAICSNNDATFNFDYKQIGGGSSNFSANNVPAGASVNFTQNNLSSDGNFDVTFSNLNAVAPGNHLIQIIADNGSETEIRNIELTVYHSTFANTITQQAPANGSIGVGTAVALTWDTDDNSEEYVVDIASDPDFSTILLTSTVVLNQLTLTGLTEGGVYYWRVRGQNRCATATDANPFNFQVGALNCNTTTQTTNTTINDEATVTSTLNVTDMVTISDLNVRVAYNHSWIGDVAITLISPSGTRVDLIEVLTCTEETNFNINFDDAAADAINCTAADNGGALTTYQPVGSLIDFNGENSNGTWTLEITDGGPGDTGTVTEWVLDICDATTFAAAPNFVNNGLNVDVNSTYTTVTGDIEASTPSESDSDQIYTLLELPTMGNLRLYASTMVVGDVFTQGQVNGGAITFENTEVAAFTDQFKVNISNAAGGWLPNQTVIINAAVLNISDFELGQLKLWPNPVQGNLHIQMNDA